MIWKNIHQNEDKSDSTDICEIQGVGLFVRTTNKGGVGLVFAPMVQWCANSKSFISMPVPELKLDGE